MTIQSLLTMICDILLIKNAKHTKPRRRAMKTQRKSPKARQHDFTEAAIANIIASGVRRHLDPAAWLSETLPVRRQTRMLRLIARAI